MGGHYEGIPSLEPNSHFVENEFPGERVSETEKCIFRRGAYIEFHEVLGFWDFYGILGFQSQNASFRATCAQKGREEKCWMLWFLLNQWSTGETSLPKKLKQSETVGNSRKQSETVRERPGVTVPKLFNPPFFFAKKKTFRTIPFFFESANGKQLETVGARTFDSAKNELFKTI